MQFRLSRNIPENESLIVIGKGEEDFIKYLPEKYEKWFLKKRLEKDKKTVTINLYDKYLFFQIAEDVSAENQAHVLEEMRKAGHKLHGEIIGCDIEQISIVHESGTCEQTLALLEGIALSNYQFIKYLREKDKKRYSLKEINLVCSHLEQQKFDELTWLIEAVYLTRDLVNEPLSWLTAVKFSEEISRFGKEADFKVEILNKKRIESLKMGGLLAVNKGSIDPPTFSILEHKPAGHINQKPIILVGKGVVFDTGGLSLKPTSDSMDYMKCDMAGGASVAGVFYAVAKARLPVHLIGLVPATDNRPDGNAVVPGDIITMYDGTTVEVLNTDAEGRLILADALAYAKQFDPLLVIDMATLTGSAQAAIGNFATVGMGNASPEIMDRLKASGYQTHERIAEFPFWDDYAELMKSDIADLKNMGGKYAGAITAGKFLEHFTNYPFIHLDIAGPSFNKKPDNYRGKGGSGVGVRLLFHFLKSYIDNSSNY